MFTKLRYLRLATSTIHRLYRSIGASSPNFRTDFESWAKDSYEIAR
jgi:hypothetical protein